MTHHNQTKELITWFLNLLLDEYIDNKRHSLNSRPHEAQLEDQKDKKSLEDHLEKGKPQKATKDTKSGKITKRVGKAQN
jgi:hypothetical protein